MAELEYDPAEIYRERVAAINVLDDISESHERISIRERRWRRIRKAAAIAPLITAAAISTHGIKEKLNTHEKEGIGLAALYFTFAGWAGSDARVKKYLLKRHETAQLAMPIAEEYSLPLPKQITETLQEQELL